MNNRAIQGLLKHGDFILLDTICLQLCYILSYWINVEPFGNPYLVVRYNYQARILFAAQMVTVLFFNNYHGILRRKRFDEFVAVVAYIGETFLIALVYFFAVHWAGEVSRLQMGGTSALFIVLDFILRQILKRVLRRFGSTRAQRRSIVLVTSSSLAADAVRRLKAQDGTTRDFFISSIILLDKGNVNPKAVDDIHVMHMGSHAVANITHGWVDEVFILQPDTMAFPSQFVDSLMEMGMTVSYSISGIRSSRFAVTDVGKLGPYAVLTSGIHDVSLGQVILKRIMDIVGGIIGCICTAIIFVFVAPQIYRESPGPIFFVQERVGRNGKVFKMYKFRSMYLDAEERKAELEARNRVDDGLMFKVDDDPRIIGSEKKDKNGNPKGIGNLIRRFSLDEFPQFYNVLRGEMSIVGTRPPTVDEWRKYDLAHRVRMSIKPGITGLWQVSGRSKITNFEQVVRLDRQYIENWSLMLDIKIILKTVVVALGGRGAL